MTVGPDLVPSGRLRAHACIFFRSEAEEEEAMLPMTRECASSGNRCIHFVAGQRLPGRRQRLGAGGIDVPRLRATGQLELLEWEGSYLHGGRFDLDAQLALVRELLHHDLPALPDARVWSWADMSWSSSNAPGSERLIEYESLLNETLDDKSGLIVCAYDLRRQDAHVVLDLLQTHPFVLVAGALRANPLYLPPQAFLPRYRARRGP